MTSIDFYARCGDPLRVAVQIAAKAWSQHGCVRVLTSDERMTAALDLLMWQWPATGFLPHCRLASPLAAETPILVDHALEHHGPAGVLVNLQPSPPPFFSRFERLAEIVVDAPEAIAAGRDRWKFYKERGYELRSHDLAERG
ncbi:MAG: DNA polymerase III subunit chi [Casimicrobiaceae bacterium]